MEEHERRARQHQHADDSPQTFLADPERQCANALEQHPHEHQHGRHHDPSHWREPHVTTELEVIGSRADHGRAHEPPEGSRHQPEQHEETGHVHGQTEGQRGDGTHEAAVAVAQVIEPAPEVGHLGRAVGPRLRFALPRLVKGISMRTGDRPCARHVAAPGHGRQVTAAIEQIRLVESLQRSEPIRRGAHATAREADAHLRLRDGIGDGGHGSRRLRREERIGGVAERGNDDVDDGQRQQDQLRPRGGGSHGGSGVAHVQRSAVRVKAGPQRHVLDLVEHAGENDQTGHRG